MGPMTGFCEHGEEIAASGATDLVSYLVSSNLMKTEKSFSYVLTVP
jgi:hypothetical protein